jgi:hypothetical protein
MSEYEVRQVEPDEHDSWDEFVEQSPQGTLYHTSRWKRVIDAAYQPASLRLLACFGPHGIVGGCVLLDREKYGQRTGVTPLLTPYAGFLLEEPPGGKLSDKVSRQAAILGAMTAVLAKEFAYQNITNSPGLTDSRALDDAGYSVTPRFTYLLNLRLPLDELWQRLDGSVRRQIRKAERAQLALSDQFDPRVGYDLFRGTFGRGGGDCPVSQELFLAVTQGDALRDYRAIHCVHDSEKLVAYIVTLRFRGTVYYAVASTHPDYLSEGHSSFLVWEVIKGLAGAEFETLDFVGANIPSIARFKEGFNPQLQLYFQVERFGSPVMKLGKALRVMLRTG